MKTPAPAPITFAAFLAGYHRDNPVGDLAQDFRADVDAPREDEELLAHIRLRAGDCDLIQDVISQAWRSYQRARKKVRR
jgi:hypothetical protein